MASYSSSCSIIYKTGAPSCRFLRCRALDLKLSSLRLAICVISQCPQLSPPSFSIFIAEIVTLSPLLSSIIFGELQGPFCPPLVNILDSSVVVNFPIRFFPSSLTFGQLLLCRITLSGSSVVADLILYMVVPLIKPFQKSRLVSLSDLFQRRRAPPFFPPLFGPFNFEVSFCFPITAKFYGFTLVSAGFPPPLDMVAPFFGLSRQKYV